MNVSDYDGMRVLLMSDIHIGRAPNPHSDNADGTSSGAESGGNADIYDEDRINILVNAANYENSKKPIDFCIIVGDCVQLKGSLPSGKTLADESDSHKTTFVASHCFMDVTPSSKICRFASQNQNVAGLIYGHAHVFNNVVGDGYYGLQTGSFFEPTYVYPTLEQITAGTHSRNLLGWRMLEEKEDNSLVTYEVQPANYYPYWDLDYPYTIQQRMTIIPAPGSADEVTVTASSYQNDDHTPQCSIDGDMSTWWSAAGLNSWINYAFGAARNISRVNISFYNASNERKSKFAIYVSSDGTSYTEVFNGQSTRSDSEPESFDIGEQKNVRAVKLICNGNTKNTWNAINEITFE